MDYGNGGSAASPLIRAFMAGLAAKRAQMQQEHDEEEYKLTKQQRQFELRQMGLKEKLQKHQAMKDHISMLEQLPAQMQEMAGPPTEEGVGAGMREVPNSPVTVPGIDDFGIPDTQVTPRTLQEVLAQKKMAEQQEHSISVPGMEGEVDSRAIPLMSAGIRAQDSDPGYSVLQEPLFNYKKGQRVSNAELSARSQAAGRDQSRDLAGERLRSGTDARTAIGEDRQAADYSKKIQPFAEAVDALEKMKAGGKTAVGDMQKLFSFMKNLDDSTVRDSEREEAIRTGGISSKIASMVSYYTSNPRLFTDAAAAQFTKEAARMLNSIKPRFQRIHKAEREVAERRGYDFRNVDRMGLTALLEEGMPTTPAAPRKGGTVTPAPGGKKKRVYNPATDEFE